MKPRFTAQFVFHYMKPEDGRAEYRTNDFEEMSRSIQHDREFEKYGMSYDDDVESVSEAALALIMDDESFKGMNDGCYVTILIAGELCYTTHTDYWSGGTECDLDIYPEWHYARILDPDERRRFDDANGIMPDVPLALFTEVDWENPFLFPTGDVFGNIFSLTK